MHQYKLVVFDWDGTLMDSIGRIVSSMQSAAKAVLLESPSDEQVKSIIGMSLPKAMSVLFPQSTHEQSERLVAQYKEYYVDLDPTPTPLFDNAIALLEQLRQQNKLLAVATGKGRNGLERVLKASNTDHLFHGYRCGDEVSSKPAPDMLTSLLQEFAIEPHEAVMIGDSTLDMEMAHNAGVDRIGVTLGVHDEHKLSKFAPKAIVNSLHELQKLLVR
ncbi:HAD family hydrolase [Colwelliaceae bacterium 6471]